MSGRNPSPLKPFRTALAERGVTTAPATCDTLAASEVASDILANVRAPSKVPPRKFTRPLRPT
jgi:hypothetical protein